jgi:hypothetical protein
MGFDFYGRTHIYIARGLVSGLLKIGRSTNVRRRMMKLCSEWEPVELIALIPGAIQLEHELHLHFAASLAGVRGVEWFRDDGAIVDFIATLPENQRGSTIFVIRRPRVARRHETAARDARWLREPQARPYTRGLAVFTDKVLA